VAIGDDLFVLGGLDAVRAASADVYRVQPSASKVALAGQLAVPVAGAGAVALGAKVLVLGGSRSGGAPLDTVQVFDPATGASTRVGTLPGPRTDLAAIPIGKEILVLGGSDGTTAVPDILATGNGTSFHVVGRLATAVRAPAVAVVGTTVFVFGGIVAGPDYTGTFSTAVQSYDAGTGLARVVGTLATPLAHARAAVLGDQLYLVGGWTPSGPSSALQRFDLQTGTLTPSGRLPGPVADAAAATIAATWYLAGGIAANPLTDIETVTLGP
jgi:N-acetylneuraminic acid mutarotase